MSEDFRLSVSKTKCFNQCKKQYEFSYILKLPKKDRDYHIFGKFCHKVLETFHGYYVEGCLLPFNMAMNDAFKAAWIEYKEKMTPEMKKDCWELINKYLRKISGSKPTNVIAVEKRFELSIADNIILNGAIDIVRLNDDNVIEVADYKTTKNKKYLKDDWFQLLTYAYVVLLEDPTIEKVRASYILLRHDFEHITTEFDAKQILAVKDRYIEYAEQMLAETDFTPNPTALCGWCDFLEHCPEGRDKANSSKTQAHKVYGEVSW